MMPPHYNDPLSFSLFFSPFFPSTWTSMLGKNTPEGRHLCQKLYIDLAFLFPVSFFLGRDIFSHCFLSLTSRPFPAFVFEHIEGNGAVPFSLIKWRIIFFWRLSLLADIQFQIVGVQCCFSWSAAW